MISHIDIDCFNLNSFMRKIKTKYEELKLLRQNAYKNASLDLKMRYKTKEKLIENDNSDIDKKLSRGEEWITKKFKTLKNGIRRILQR
ncbi:MAG: hypothetical protein A2Y62_04725 [Candidatus Fischerbacteria bacterium RBG_13_37_8]|uniref:Uncharacterized protein n=1 Tax=Candidatus Fischerbacteria bacterium RBG_13_37_8 TaxID=1817863 RepID=A0A1F5VUD2_9BACT|nr:MAG: hypothetical protein A2Y62_04725 [Candidatus Fischerbacteria bacterium RBG_13_37_8]